MPKISIILFCFMFYTCISNNDRTGGEEERDTEQTSEKTYSPDSVLKVALIQPEAIRDPEINIKRGKSYCVQAKAKGADIVVFPEMYNMGYDPGIDFKEDGFMDAWKKQGITENGVFVSFFRILAKELEMAILITFLEKWEPLPRNTAVLFDRHGERVLKYSKVHTVDLGFMEAVITPGDDFYVADLDTRIGTIKTGVMICYDREFPESARILMLKGAELILTPNACKLDHLRIIQFQARAWENSLVTVMANYSEETFNGHSCAFDANGEEIMVAGEEEGVFMAEFNLQEIREYRKWTFWGNAYRRPRKYGLLTSEEVDEPFVRYDAFGNRFDRTKR